MADISVYAQLRREILSCALAPGSKVFEQELAERFGVSKSPVREALLRLQEQNLVDVQPRSGYRVRPISLTEAGEMYEMRYLYERACVMRAITHASDAALASLHDHLLTKARVPIPEWIEANRRFHSSLASVCGNHRLADAATKLNDQFDRFTFVSVTRLDQPPDFTRFNNDHLALVRAMQKRDKRRAAAIVKSHIDASRERTFQALASPAIVP
jgi:DNA-binding GntR family transcriptional regulator